MERYILGIDIGTTSVKALLISESGALAAEGKADHDLISAHPGWAEENAEVWWSNAVAAVRQITDAHPDMAENIVSAGVSGMVPALALLDHDGKPVRNTIQQNDARAVAQIEKLTALLDQDELYERTGTRTNQQHVLPRLLWVKENEPEVFARSEYVVGSYEFVTGRMTGARYIESNWAVESGLYDIRRQCWMTEQFSVLGVDKGYFPPVIASHEKALAFAQELQSPLMQLISGGALLEDDPEQSRSRSMDGICRLTKLAERARCKACAGGGPQLHNCQYERSAPRHPGDCLAAAFRYDRHQCAGAERGELFYGGRAAGKGSLPRAFYRHRSSEKWNVPCTGRWNAPNEGLPEGAFRLRLHGRHHAGALGNNLPPLRAAGNGKEPCVSARKQLVKLRKPKNRTCLSNQAGPVLLSEACAFSCQISRRRAR